MKVAVIAILDTGDEIRLGKHAVHLSVDVEPGEDLAGVLASACSPEAQSALLELASQNLFSSPFGAGRA